MKSITLTTRQAELVKAAMSAYVPTNLDKTLAALSTETLIKMKLDGTI